MSATDMSQLWDLLRENEKTIAVLATKLDSTDESIKKLREDSDAMKAILNRAIGEKSAIVVVGSAIAAIITWAVTYFSTKGGN